MATFEGEGAKQQLGGAKENERAENVNGHVSLFIVNSFALCFLLLSSEHSHQRSNQQIYIKCCGCTEKADVNWLVPRLPHNAPADIAKDKGTRIQSGIGNPGQHDGKHDLRLCLCGLLEEEVEIAALNTAKPLCLLIAAW